MQWPGPPCSDSHLGVSGHSRLNPPGSRRSQLGAPVLHPELGTRDALTLSCVCSGGAATGARPPCSPLPALPLPAAAAAEASQSLGGSFPSPADVRAVPTGADSAFPSSGRGSPEAAELPGREPLHHSSPCAALRFHVTFWSLPLAVRGAPPTRTRLSGQPQRRQPRTGVRRAAPAGLGPRGPGSS